MWYKNKYPVKALKGPVIQKYLFGCNLSTEVFGYLFFRFQPTS